MGTPSILAFILFATACYVSAQFNGRVEFVSPPATVSATSYIQPTNQFVIPAIIKPIIPETFSQPPSIPNYPEFESFNSPYMQPNMQMPMPMHMPMPMPIFMGSRDDDDWHHLLYFLVFANLRNRWNNGYGYNYGNGCGCGCGCGGNGCGNSGCGCGNSGCDDGCGYNSYNDIGNCGCNNNGVVYIPYPIPVPSNVPSCYPSLFSGTVDSPPFSSDDLSYGPTLQACAGREPNEINLVIRTDCSK
ncbi:unnamed protein product [Danaus chrysippus]|uniref:(African queen) hypothetical protein n=1 Tax=Danaus chrysippus TaxID=151541 RepID=A0A8J2RC98_9NEOP|nr:unnamed protein product [Danaus chrysippus]